MAYNNPISKIERAIRQYLIQQGTTSVNDCFISNDSRIADILPNRKIQCSSFTPQRPMRPEGICHLQIQHHFAAAQQPGEPNPDAQRIGMDEYLGDTMDSMLCGDDQSLNVVADAITVAGRSLAVTDNTPQGNVIAQNNADMVNFRCDWIKQAHPFITRGNSGESTNWVEILNFDAFVSTAAI